MAGVLATVGWVAEVLVNKRSGFVVDGHMRVAHAISHGEPTVPVAYTDLDEREEALVLATFDPIGHLAVPDVAKRDELYEKLHADTANNLRVLFGQAAEAAGTGYGGGASTTSEVGETTRWSMTFPTQSADAVREALTELTESVEGLTWNENG